MRTTHPLQRQRNSPPRGRRQHSKGLALFIVLVFLLLMSILAIWAAKRALMGENFARNQLDWEIAHQAAEAALRDAERDITNPQADIVLPRASCRRGFSGALLPVYFTRSVNCHQGLCFQSNAAYEQANWSNPSSNQSEPWWPISKKGLWGPINGSSKPLRQFNGVIDSAHCDFKGGVPLGTFTGTTALFGVSNQPEYLIEFFERYNPTSYEPANYYRITARGFGYHPATQVVLQTIFYQLR